MNAKTDPTASDDPASSAAASQRAEPVPPPTNPHFALFVATAGGLGYFPKAPGTLGSLVGLVLAVLPYWVCFGLGAAIIAAHSGDYGIFLSASNWYSDPFLWAQIALTFFIAGLGVWASDLVAKSFREKDPQICGNRRSIGPTSDAPPRLRNPRLVESCTASFEYDAARPHHHARGAPLEIFAPGFYTFSSIRYLEAVPGASGGIVTRRLGHHGGRLDRRNLRRDRPMARACSGSIAGIFVGRGFSHDIHHARSVRL